MSFLPKLFGRSRPRDRLATLYAAVVSEARRPHWYVEGGVPDTIDGRFDLVATVLSLVLLRMEQDGDAARSEQALLAELFVEDMDGQLRERGIGDLVVGKHVGNMMGALGGRLGAYREALASGDFTLAARRNLYRDAPPSESALAHSIASLDGLAGRLAASPLDALLAGRIG
jgi:cytochrome b pre-mRNA-processing protein 3